MESPVPVAERLLTIMCAHARWSECEGCLANDLAIDLPDLWTAIAQLCADHLVRLAPGVCSVCHNRVDFLLTLVLGMWT